LLLYAPACVIRDYLAGDSLPVAGQFCLARKLESRGIIKESTGRARDRVYVYRRYLEALAAEEEATPVGASVAPGA
jgi:hypothetical protein